MSLDRRLQITLDKDRHARLVAVAQERGVSVASVVREAIDGDCRRPTPSVALRRAHLASESIPALEPEDLVAELDDLRARRE